METEKTLSAKQDKFQIGIFPNYFKKIGISILILFFIPSLIIKLLDVSYYIENKIFFRELTTSIFILGLFLIAWSKEKTENSYTHLLRYKAIAFSFFFAVGRVLLTPLIDFIFGDSLGETKPSGVILNMLMIYLFIFYLTKKAGPKEIKT